MRGVVSVMPSLVANARVSRYLNSDQPSGSANGCQKVRRWWTPAEWNSTSRYVAFCRIQVPLTDLLAGLFPQAPKSAACNNIINCHKLLFTSVFRKMGGSYTYYIHM